MTSKSRENFLRNVILVVDLCKDALVSLIELDLTNKGKTFEQFVNDNQHEIFHLHNSSKCCQCTSKDLLGRTRIMYSSQMKLLFDPSLKSQCKLDFCCSTAKVGICVNVLDLTLAKCLLVNFCTEIFWSSCLQLQFMTFENFLNQNKHEIYHLWKNKTTCCQCQLGYTFPEKSLFVERDFKEMFCTVWPPCSYHTTCIHNICSVEATPGKTLADLSPKVKRIILLYFSKLRKVVEAIGQIRNNNYGHVNECLMSDNEYIKTIVKIERLIMKIAKVRNTEGQFKKKIQEAINGPIDQTLFMKYQNLMELHTRQQYIHLLSKEEFNFLRIGIIVLNILTDVLYDRFKLDVPDKTERQRENCDISLLYNLHRKHNTHIPSRGVWGGTWINIAQHYTAIGDDIERIRLLRNELLHSARYGLDEMRFNELYNVVYELLSRFDLQNKPSVPYLDRLKGILVNTSYEKPAKND